MIHTQVGTDVQQAARYLMQNLLVAIPTETVYGLAGNALNAHAVAAIYAAKNRPQFNPLILHVPSLASIDVYAHLHPVERSVAAAFMPGALTLLLPKKEVVPYLVTAGSTKVAIRIPAHPMAQELLSMLPFPLAAPSANPSGYISPVTAAHVLQGLAGKLSYILDGGVATAGLESTIAEYLPAENKMLIHRKGTITLEDIAAVARVNVAYATELTGVQTPGQLKSHYAPRKPLFMGLLEEWDGLPDQYSRVAVVSFTPKMLAPPYTSFALSETGNLAEAAAHLFSTLRQLDEDESIDAIVAEPVPMEGIGMAINDRLHRAQHQWKPEKD